MNNGHKLSLKGWWKAALRWFHDEPAAKKTTVGGAAPAASLQRQAGTSQPPGSSGLATASPLVPSASAVGSVAGSEGQGAEGGVGTMARAPRTRLGGERVFLPLQPVLKLLPETLKGRIRQPVPQDLEISLPLEPLLAQLQTGLVRIPFGELRLAAPGVFSGGADCDSTLVPLPLDELVRRIGADRLPRRTPQKVLTVPEDVASPFDQGRLGLRVGGPQPVSKPSPAGGSPTGAPSLRVVPASQLHSTAPPLNGDTTVTRRPPSHLSGAPPRGVVPPASEGLAAQPPRVATPMPPLHPPVVATPPLPVNGQSARVSAVPVTAPSPPAVPPAAVSPATITTATSAESMAGTVQLALDDLVSAWPESVRQELGRLNVQGARLVLPAAILEKGLKQGRVEFPWRLVRAWIRPPVATYASPQDALPLSFPLTVVVPAFLQQRKPVSHAKRQLVPDPSIPSLFNEKGAPLAPTAAPEPSTPGPGAPPAAALAASGAAPRPVDTNFYSAADLADGGAVAGPSTGTPVTASSSTELMRRLATPQEIVRRAAALEGVAGAVIALPDGLSVASQVPPHLNSDTLAAFLPQIYAKVSQCTQELRMGALNNLSFTVGQVPWKIFKVNNVFFAAFGRAGEPLPTAALAALAAELDRKPKTT